MKFPICPSAILRVLTIVILSLSLIPLSISAQLNYTTFTANDTNDFSILSDAAIVGNSLRLIRGQNSGHAAVWHNDKHLVTNGFVSMFTFRIINGSGETGGADGFAFVIQNSSKSAIGGIGGRGGNIGYGRDENPQILTPGIKNSIAIEFDTFENAFQNDPNNNHISVHTRGQMENSSDENASIASTVAIPALRNGGNYTLRVEYDGPSGSTPHQWRVFLQNLNTPILTFVRNIGDILANGESDAWVGFTAGSAAEWENHDVLSWSFSPIYSDSLPGFTAPNADISGPLSVSSSDYHPDANGEGDNLNAKIDTTVLPDRKTELWAKYYFPENLSGGPYPLVILKHGNHNSCGFGANPRIDDNSNYSDTGECVEITTSTGTVLDYKVVPSHEGYDYLAEKLASWGYIVASINSNLGITGSAIGYRRLTFSDFDKFGYPEDIFLMLARGRLILRHLQKLSEWNEGTKGFTESTTLDTKQLKANKTGWYGKGLLTSSTPIKIRSLGRLFENGNSENHRLRIVRVSDNVVIAETIVNMASGTHGHYNYGEVTPSVTLAPNTLYYLVSEERKRGDRWREATVTVGSLAEFQNDVVSTNDGVRWKRYNKSISLDFMYELDSTTPTSIGVNLKGKIDFGNVGLMGHSRGGEGVRAAYTIYEESDSPWKSRIRNLKIQGIFEFAPTDGAVRDSLNNATELNADGTAWNVLLGACDGDLFFLPGVKPFDRMLQNNMESPAKPKSVYYVYGTNHNFYNTQWQVSDSYHFRTVSRDEPNGCVGEGNDPLFVNPVVTGSGYGTVSQQKTGSSPFMAFMRANVGSSANPNFNQNFNPLFKVPSDVRSVTKIERSYTPSSSSTQTLIVNDLKLPSGSNVCSNATVNCSGVVSESTLVQRRNDSVYGGLINHDNNFTAARVSWTSPGPNTFIQANSSSASINASTFETLDFRVSRRRSDTDELMIDALNTDDLTNVSIQLVMADGSISNAIGIGDAIRLAGPIGKSDQTRSVRNASGAIVDDLDAMGELHPILRTVRFPLNEFSGVNLTQIRGVRFIFNHTSSGAINLSNIRFSK